LWISNIPKHYSYHSHLVSRSTDVDFTRVLAQSIFRLSIMVVKTRNSAQAGTGKKPGNKPPPAKKKQAKSSPLEGASDDEANNDEPASSSKRTVRRTAKRTLDDANSVVEFTDETPATSKTSSGKKSKKASDASDSEGEGTGSDDSVRDEINLASRKRSLASKSSTKSKRQKGQAFDLDSLTKAEREQLFKALSLQHSKKTKETEFDAGGYICFTRRLEVF